MAAVAASEEKAARYISKLDIDSRAAIAVYNGPESHMVSGEMKAVEKLIFVVKADGIRATELVVDQGEFNIVIAQMLSDPLSGFRSPSIAPALPALKAWFDKHEASFNVLEKPFFSYSFQTTASSTSRLSHKKKALVADSPLMKTLRSSTMSSISSLRPYAQSRGAVKSNVSKPSPSSIIGQQIAP